MTSRAQAIEAPFLVDYERRPLAVDARPSRAYSRLPMQKRNVTRSGLAVVALVSLLALTSMASQAAGYSPGCGQIPIVYGIPHGGSTPGRRSAKRAASLGATAKSIWKRTPSQESCVRKSAPESTQPARSP
jgi:hypothetical protein